MIVIDFESASAVDLKKAGAWVYSESPTTEIICLGFAYENGEVKVYSGDDLADPERSTELRQFAEDPEVIFAAHNVSFEKSIWRNMMIPMGWPDIPDERWHDTMAVCAMKSLPLKLEKASKVLRLATQKDMEGSKLVMSFSRLKKGYADRDPAKLTRAMQYCGTDVKGEVELLRRVRGLGPEERRVWLLDQKINQRGIRIDLDFVQKAQKICDDASLPLAKEFETLTGLGVGQRDKVLEWLVSNGCPFPINADAESETFGQPLVNLQKETINKILGDRDEEDDETLAGDEDESGCDQDGERTVPYSCRRALRIRKILGSASIKKLASMRACVGSDGRARWLLQYHGAGPGRWAGRLLQPQNFPRPTLKISDGFDDQGKEKFVGHDPDQLVAAILSGDSEYVRLCFGEPIEAVANSLRHALIPADGNLFEVGDFAQVEARIVLALAGQHDKTAIMAAGQSPYIPMAETIFKCKVDKHLDLKEYQVGKNTVLGCGFQMGWRKFRSRYCPAENEEFAKRAIDAYRNEFAPKVPKLWYALEDAATKTVWDRIPHEAYGVEYRLEDGWLTCRLPSGRKLWYYDPKSVRKAMPWDANVVRPGFTYGAQKMGQWKRISAYGGLLTENVVQATARDLLVNALFNCERALHPVVLTVHDEGANEVPEAMADAKLMEQMMTDIPQWARAMQVPIGAECWVGDRYRK